MPEHPLQTYYSRIYKTYDLVNRLFTFGLDKKWRLYTVSRCLSFNPGNVLDLCCGTGDLTIDLRMNGTKTLEVTGYDLNREMLTMAHKKAEKSGVIVKFIHGNAADMPFKDASFDCITIGFGFRNLTWENPERDRHLNEMTRVMKQGSKMLILESARPPNSIIRFFYKLYLNTILVPLGGILSGNWKAYAYLAGSSAGFYSFNELADIMEKFGFSLELDRRFLFGSANLLIATKQ